MAQAKEDVGAIATRQQRIQKILKTILCNLFILGECKWYKPALESTRDFYYTFGNSQDVSHADSLVSFIIWIGCTVIEFFDSVFRGIAQVVFINNPISYDVLQNAHCFSGIIIWVGLAIDNVWIALLGLLGTMASTLVATWIVLDLDRAQIRDGLFGYNGVLVGMGMGLFLQSNMPTDWWRIAIPTILMGAISTVVRVTFLNLFPRTKQAQMPMFTLPFNITAFIFLAASYQFSFYPVNTSLLKTRLLQPLDFNLNHNKYDWIVLLTAIPKGISEVYLVENWITGVLIFVGTFWSSPLCGIAALLGTITGIIFAVAFGVPVSTIGIGLFGYNSVIGFIAIFGVFYKASVQSLLLAIVCSLLCVFIQGCFFTVLAPVGLPSLTFPFCFSAILCVGMGKTVHSRLVAQGLPLD